jgi:hypothetical protein
VQNETRSVAQSRQSKSTDVYGQKTIAGIKQEMGDDRRQTADEAGGWVDGGWSHLLCVCSAADEFVISGVPSCIEPAVQKRERSVACFLLPGACYLLSAACCLSAFCSLMPSCSQIVMQPYTSQGRAGRKQQQLHSGERDATLKSFMSCMLLL